MLTQAEKEVIRRAAQESHETMNEYMRVAAKGRVMGLLLRLPSDDDPWPSK